MLIKYKDLKIKKLFSREVTIVFLQLTIKSNYSKYEQTIKLWRQPSKVCSQSSFCNFFFLKIWLIYLIKMYVYLCNTFFRVFVLSVHTKVQFYLFSLIQCVILSLSFSSYTFLRSLLCYKIAFLCVSYKIVTNKICAQLRKL